MCVLFRYRNSSTQWGANMDDIRDSGSPQSQKHARELPFSDALFDGLNRPQVGFDCCGAREVQHDHVYHLYVVPLL